MVDKKMKYIKIFATGGTFDKEFNEINGELYFKETNLFQLLQLVGDGLLVYQYPRLLHFFYLFFVLLYLSILPMANT